MMLSVLAGAVRVHATKLATIAVTSLSVGVWAGSTHFEREITAYLGPIAADVKEAVHEGGSQ